MDPMMQGGNPLEPIPPPVETPPPVAGYCRTCGLALTDQTKRIAMGTMFCEEHVPVAGSRSGPEPGSPYEATGALAASSASPALAWILGFTVPGLGAIYNAQYAKGLVHVLIFGLLISLLSSGSAGGFEPLIGISLGGFVFYQAFEAYHTAKRREQGLPNDEFSSIFSMRSGTAAVPVAMILVGVLFLLGNLGWLRLEQILRFWPVGLIGLGGYMLYNRVKGDPTNAE